MLPTGFDTFLPSLLEGKASDGNRRALYPVANCLLGSVHQCVEIFSYLDGWRLSSGLSQVSTNRSDGRGFAMASSMACRKTRSQATTKVSR